MIQPTAGRGVSGHHLPNRGRSDDWITPPEIIAALGKFDLDPCQCTPQPWPCAAHAYTELGLAREWFGRVWCNPPYGPETSEWLDRLALHGRGTALVFARTETTWFFRHVWAKADAILFLEGRLFFHNPDGSRAENNSGGPSVLIAYGEQDAEALKNSGLPGAVVTDWMRPDGTPRRALTSSRPQQGENLDAN